MSKADITFNPIIPIHFLPIPVEDIREEIVGISEATGFKRFIMVYPGTSVRIEGSLTAEKISSFAERLTKLKNSLVDMDIEIGWWTSTLKCGPNPYEKTTSEYDAYDYQRITDISGAISPISACPLDRNFIENFVGGIKEVVSMAHPFLVQFEDDYELSNHGVVRCGCFCPLHLSSFSERVGKLYSREELLEIFKRADRESARLRRQWAENSRDSMVALSRSVRRGIDEADETVRACLCQPGVTDQDGDLTLPVAKALAGERLRPMIRVYGTSYSSDDPVSIPTTTFHMLYTSQHSPPEYELYHESDTYPHTRFYMSASKMRTLLEVAFLYGLDDSLFYGAQYVDKPFEESGYFTMASRDKQRFVEIMKSVADTTVAGVQTVYHPFQHASYEYDVENGKGRRSANSKWAQVFGQLGIPYTTTESSPKALCGSVFQEWEDSEIRKLLSGAVLLDGVAAGALCDRGFGDLLGVHAASNSKIRCLYEHVADEEPWCTGVTGRLIYNNNIAPAGKEGGTFFDLEADASTIIVSTFMTPNFEPLSPALTVCENNLGGRIGVIAYDLDTTQSASIYNYRKKTLMKNVIEWLIDKPLPVYIPDHPNVFLIALEDNAGRYGITATINLSSDPIESIKILRDEHWAERNKLQVLTDSGEWTDLPADISSQEDQVKQSSGDVVEFSYRCPTMQPLIVRHGT